MIVPEAEAQQALHGSDVSRQCPGDGIVGEVDDLQRREGGVEAARKRPARQPKTLERDPRHEATGSRGYVGPTADVQEVGVRASSVEWACRWGQCGRQGAGMKWAQVSSEKPGE